MIKGSLRMKKKSLLILFFMLSVAVVKGQDIHFMQFNLHPLALNPALTGMMEGNLRAGAIYRNQWRSISEDPFVTFSLYGDKKITLGEDNAGAGIMLLTDGSGPGGLSTNDLRFSGSYRKKWGRSSLVFGLQPGFVYRSLGNTTFPAQFDPESGRFNPFLPSLEPEATRDAFYFDLNVGGIYRYERKNWKITAGQAFFHILRPNGSLVKGYRSPVPVRSVTHLRGVFELAPKWYLLPGFLYMEDNRATELILGPVLKYRVSREGEKPFELRLGAYYRNNVYGYQSGGIPENVDALTVNTGLGISKWNLGIAYDVNISELSEASLYRGAVEIVLTYLNPFQVQVSKKQIPCYRY